MKYDEIVDDIGVFIDRASLDQDDNLLVDIIHKAENILKDIDDNYLQGKLNYYIAVAYSDLNSLRCTTGDVEKEKNYEKQIIYYRKALHNFDKLRKVSDKEMELKSLMCMCYTNLGNYFNEIGRFVEAIEYWNMALKISDKFGMALGNKGIGLYHYSSVLYDDSHQDIFFHHSYNYLKKAISYSESLYEGTEQVFLKYVDYIERAFLSDYLNEELTLKEYPLGEIQEEKEYRQWCLNNVLFLNPLNDVIRHIICAQDILSTPSIVAAIDASPKFQGFYNQLKQEFVSARYMYYESIHNKGAHFSDREVLLFNTLDYPVYGIKVEKVKNAFKTSYSLFDKIAYFINDYFEVGIKERDVSYRSIWFKEKRGKDSYKYKKHLKHLMNERSNWPLRGLYWLFKDLYDDKSGVQEYLEPQAQELSKLRNHMEHKYLKIHEYDVDWEDFFKDDLAFSITFNSLSEKTLKILKLVRAALIYLSLLINIEERHREKDREGSKGIIAPMLLGEYEDEWKY